MRYDGDLISAKWKSTLRMQNLFGAGSKHRKNFLENYQWSMTWTEYKKKFRNKKI